MIIKFDTDASSGARLFYYERDMASSESTFPQTSCNHKCHNVPAQRRRGKCTIPDSLLPPSCRLSVTWCNLELHTQFHFR